MRHFPWMLSLLCLVMFTGCPAQQPQDATTTGPEQKEAVPAPAASTGDTPDVTTEDVKQKVSEATKAVGALAEQKTAEALNAARVRYDDAKERISELKANMDKLHGDAQEQLRKSVDALDKKMAVAEDELNQLAEASGDAWTEAEGNLQNAMRELKNAYDQAVTAFEEAESKKQASGTTEETDRVLEGGNKQ